MRSRHLLAALVLIPATSHAAEPAPIAATGVSLPRPAGLPADRTYAGAVFATGGDAGHVVVSEGSDPARPAHWMRVDDDGRIVWEADHACPTFDDYATVFTPSRVARTVCKVGGLVIAVDLADGREAWRFTDPRPLYMIVAAGGRVAVSVDNEQVAVLDAMTGRELLRYDVEGAVLEAAAESERGPLALLVRDSPERGPPDTIDLPVGPGGATAKVELAGDDPGRKLVAIAIGGPAVAGVSRPTPRWAVPFAGYSFDLQPSLGAVIGEPSDGRTTSYDLATGRVLWERPTVEGEQLTWADDGGVFARPLAGGGILYGALDARRGKTLWSGTIATDATVAAVGAGDGDLGVAFGAGFRMADFATGHITADQAFEPGEQLVSLHSTRRSVLWVSAQGDSRAVHVAPIAR
ncbi:MAG: PQQ-binding-like beta-propeller repeat protein [Myxococcota bacterium]